jgi:hypothetical protein
MKFSSLSLIALMGCLLFSSAQVMAIHHESQDSQSPHASSVKMANNEGTVVDIIDTTGYTYMELENGGNRFWIAAPTTKVNKGDRIRFVQDMVMTNFTSKTLNRTFGTLVFVSSTEVKK